jgi:hypothetical protein
MLKRKVLRRGLGVLFAAPLLCMVGFAWAAELPPVGSGSLLLQLKADAANVTLGAGNVVSQWSDISGLNNHFSQPATSRQPLWVDSTLNGHPTIRFDGNSDWLQATDAGLNVADRTQFTFFAVTYNTTDPFSLFDSAPQVVNPFRFGAFGAGFPTPRFHVEFWDRSPGVPLNLHSTGSVVSIAGSRNGTNNRVLDVRELSLEAETANTSGIGNTAVVAWGGNPFAPTGANANPKIGTINNGDGGFFYTGDVAEMLIYNGTLSAADRTAVENYLRDEYALHHVPPPPPTPTSPSGLANYGRAVLDAQPVAYWRLETNLSPPTDSADAPGFPQHGPQNGVYQDINAHNLGQPGPRPTDFVNGRPLLGFSAENHAADFQGNADGGNDVALFADDGNLNMSAGGAFTLEAWVKGSPAQEVGAAVIAKGAGGGDEQFALDIVNGAYRFFAWNGQNPNTPTVLQTGATPDDTWQHVAAVMDIGEGVMQVYVNGQLVGAAAPPSTIVNNAHAVSVGARESQGSINYDHNFDGLIDEVAVYSYALSAQEVQAHFDAAFIPEPSTMALALIGGMLLAGARLMRRRHS